MHYPGTECIYKPARASAASLLCAYWDSRTPSICTYPFVPVAVFFFFFQTMFSSLHFFFYSNVTSISFSSSRLFFTGQRAFFLSPPLFREGSENAGRQWTTLEKRFIAWSQPRPSLTAPATEEKRIYTLYQIWRQKSRPPSPQQSGHCIGT